jgi:hypothetical protein
LRDHPDHHDAELLLRLFELRREDRLRQAREWFLRDFHAETFEEFRKRSPQGSQENTYFRMVTSYWEMAASIVNYNLVQEEFLFENTNELWVVWQKLKHLAPGAREMYRNPHVWKNLEIAGEKFEKWMTRRAPEAIGALRKLVVEAPSKK